MFKTIGNQNKLAAILFRISNDSILEWSDHSKTKRLEIRTSERSECQYVFGIQAPSVFNLIKLGLQKFLIFLMNLAFEIESKLDLCNANIMNVKYF